MRFYGQVHPIASEYEHFPVPLRAIHPLESEKIAAGWQALKDPANVRKFGKKEAVHPNAVCYYHPPFLAHIFTALGEYIRQFLDFDIVETYYYARLYGTGDQLKLHTDRGECFVSVSLCFGYEFSPMFPEGSSWPIGALEDVGSGPEKETIFPLQPGDGILYPGCSAPHWRDMFLGNHCGQAFFHWVPRKDDVFAPFYGDPEHRK